MAFRKSHEIIPSGKYKGWSINQVPPDYLSWLKSYGKGSFLYDWYHGKNKKVKAKSRHKQVGGNHPAQGVKTGPVRSSRLFRVRTNPDGTTTRIEVPR